VIELLKLSEFDLSENEVVALYQLPEGASVVVADAGVIRDRDGNVLFNTALQGGKIMRVVVRK